MDGLHTLWDERPGASGLVTSKAFSHAVKFNKLGLLHCIAFWVVTFGSSLSFEAGTRGMILWCFRTHLTMLRLVGRL